MIRISTKLDYGIIVMQTLAKNRTNEPLSLSSIAAKNNLPYRYLGQIVARLKKAKLIVSYEGANGGYVLARPSSRISLLDIADAIEPKKCLTRCTTTSGQSCTLSATCALSPWWQTVDKKFRTMLGTTMLASLL